MYCNRIKKIALIMSLLICTTSIWGCGNKDSKNASVSNNTSSDSLPQFPLSTPITIKAMMPEIGGQYKNVPAMERFTKLTGIKIELDIAPIDDYREKQMVILASGNLPDAMCLTGTSNKSVRDMSLDYGNQGTLVNFSKYYNNMPNLKAWAEKYPKMINGLSDDNGNFYAIADGNTYNMVPESFLVNEKAFQKNNITVPTTTDEFYTTLKKLKEIYPNSTPWTVRWGLGHLMDPASRLFSTQSAIYYNKNQGKYLYGPIEDNYKKSLEFLNKLYKEQLLDNEFATLSDEQWKEKLLNNRAFVVFDYKHETRSVPGTLQDAATKQNKTDFKMVPVSPLKNNGMETKYGGQEAINTGWSIAINAKSKYVKELVKLMDWQLGDEFITLANWGIEGTTYKVENGKKVFLDTLKNSKNPNGTVELANITSRYVGLFPKGDNSADEIGGAFELYSTDKVLATGDFPPAWELTFSKEATESNANYMTAIKTYVDECTVKFITGEISLDKWDSYVKKVQDMGINNVLKTYVDALAKVKK